MSSDYPVKFLRDEADIKYYISNKWIDTPGFKNKNKKLNLVGHTFEVFAKKERKYHLIERICRGIFGVLAVCLSLGCALKSRTVRHLFTNKTKKIRFAKEIKLDDPKKPPIAHTTETLTEPKSTLAVQIQKSKSEASTDKPLTSTEPNSTQSEQLQKSKSEASTDKPLTATEPKATQAEQIKKTTPEVPTDKPVAPKQIPAPSSGVIKNGYGEYLIYRMKDGQREPISEEEYLKVYDIIEEQRSLSDDIPEDTHAYLKAKIQEKLGNDISLAFIPGTLFELIYLSQCFQEELDKGTCTSASETQIEKIFLEDADNPFYVPPEKKQKVIDGCIKQGFWQQSIFEDKDYQNNFVKKSDHDYRHDYIKKVAARLNDVAIKLFKDNVETDGFTYEQIEKVSKELIGFCRELHDSNSELHNKVKRITPRLYPGITMAFATETSDSSLRELFPLGINDDKQQEIVKKAIQLECSAEAVNSIFLYRGARFEEDTLTRVRFKETHPNSLSYGTSLFAGALFDGGATAFHYMRKKWLDAQVMVIPRKEIKKSPFHLQNVNRLKQLMSKGEVFHGRTKVWKLDDTQKVYGYDATGGAGGRDYSKIPESCRTDMSQEETEKSFAEYKSKAYILDKPKLQDKPSKSSRVLKIGEGAFISIE